MRSKKAIANIIASLSLEILKIIFGLIIPRLILQKFGSNVNGLVSSISQFLSYIVLLESGVGGVARAALYKPLADNDNFAVSRIVKAVEDFFKTVALIYLGYLVTISTLYPYLVKENFDYFFTFTLALIIGFSTFVQYYFGITYQIILNADQKKYISTSLEICTTVLNSLAIIFLIYTGFSIHIVKLTSASIFIIRPLLIRRYVLKKYGIIHYCEPDKYALKQRWDGLGHHIAFFLHSNTDIVVLTIFQSINEVSVYSVYYLVIANIQKITVTFFSSLEAAFGNMIANNEKETLDKNFRLFEFFSFSITTVLFTATAILILPFIKLYTIGITDADYYRPTFAYILILAEAIYCIRIPYNSVVLAAGHFRQTRNGAFVEAFINIVLSCILVIPLGVTGVAIGTLCAMLIRTIEYAIYLSRNILKRNISEFIKRMIIYACTSAIIIFVVSLIPHMIIDSYLSWIIYAIEVVLIATIITTIISFLFYFKDIGNTFSMLKRIVSKSLRTT